MLGLGDHAIDPLEFTLNPAAALTVGQPTSLPAAAAVGAVASIGGAAVVCYALCAHHCTDRLVARRPDVDFSER